MGYRNFSKFTVDGTAGYSATQTTITISGAESGKMPNPHFIASWWNSTDYGDPADDPNAETIKATGLSAGNIITVLRGYDNTAASAKNIAGKVYKMVAGVSREHANQSFGNNFGYNLDVGLRKYRTLLNATGGPIDIVCIGESITEGYTSNDPGTQSWISLVRAKMQSVYGDGGIGLAPFYRGSGSIYGNGWSISTGIANLLTNRGPFRCARHNTNTTATVYGAAIRGTGVNFALHHMLSSSFGVGIGPGNATYQVDSGPGTGFSTLGSFNYSDTTTNVPLGFRAEHVITINTPTGAGKNAEIWGGSFMNGMTGNIYTGCRVHNVGKNGTKIEDTVSTNLEMSFLSQIRPALTIINFSSNNYSTNTNLNTYESNIELAARTGLLYGSVLLMTQPSRNEAPLGGSNRQREYNERMRIVADRLNCAYIDIDDRWGTGVAPTNLGCMADNIHPNSVGHYDISRFILKAILEV